jgi:glycosyltransferase involved in cell wall biosynthesis
MPLDLRIERDSARANPLMNILLSVHHEFDRNAGAAGVIARLSDEFAAAGHSVRIYSFDDLPKQLPKKLKKLAFPLFLGAHIIAGRRAYDVLDCGSGDAWIGYSLMRGRTPLKVTHSHGLEQMVAEVEQREALKAGRPPSFLKKMLRYGYSLFAVSTSFRRADLSLVLNPAEADYLATKEGIPADRIRRARLGTSIGADKPEELYDRPDVTCVQIGSYIERKGIVPTAQAMTVVMRERPSVRLKFVGTGASRERVLQDYPAELHDRIEVVDRYRNTALPELLADSVIQLMPSLFEGYGIAKIEAMACGVVPIVSDDGGTITDVKDGWNGLVVKTGDGEALAAAVKRLIDDRALLASLARNGRETARLADWRVIAGERLDAYREFAG